MLNRAPGATKESRDRGKCPTRLACPRGQRGPCKQYRPPAHSSSQCRPRSAGASPGAGTASAGPSRTSLTPSRGAPVGLRVFLQAPAQRNCQARASRTASPAGPGGQQPRPRHLPRWQVSWGGGREGSGASAPAPRAGSRGGRAGRGQLQPESPTLVHPTPPTPGLPSSNQLHGLRKPPEDTQQAAMAPGLHPRLPAPPRSPAPTPFPMASSSSFSSGVSSPFCTCTIAAASLEVVSPQAQLLQTGATDAAPSRISGRAGRRAPASPEPSTAPRVSLARLEGRSARSL